jgi:arylsulfatase A-like enzyme
VSTTLAVVLSALALALVGCGSPVEEPTPPVVTDPPNIVVFLIDTLRADRLGLYGYDTLPTSPRMDGLAEQSVVFDHAYAPAPWTLPSVASIFTSTHICEHGVIHDRNRLHESFETLAERLGDSGYRTLGLTGNPYVGADFGTDQGFDMLEFSRRNDAGKVRPVLDGEGTDPYFLYVHNMEPHGAERYGGAPQEGFPEVDAGLRDRQLEVFRAYRRLTRVDFASGRRELGSTDNTDEQIELMNELDAHLEANQALYDAAVRLADERVGSVVDLLVERGEWDNTLFVVVSDHGEELADHGGWQHDQSVYEELVWVPLLVKLPEGAHAGQRVERPVSLVDLAPTILELAGVSPGLSSARGASLAPLITDGKGPATPEVLALRINRKKYFRPWKESRGDVNVVVRSGNFKGIWNAEPDAVELYDLAADPWELEDLAAERSELAETLRGVAQEWLAACGAGAVSESTGHSDETRDRLRALGYVE